MFAISQGGGGAMVGEFQLRNNGSSACWLTGRPDVTVLDPAGRPLAIRVVPPRRAGSVRLRPHEAAEDVFAWRNWCRATPAPAGMRLQLPADGGRIAVKSGIGRPRCDEPKADSTLTVSTFGRAT